MAESFLSVSLEEKKMREMTKSTNFLWEGKHRKDYFVYIKKYSYIQYNDSRDTTNFIL